MDNSKTLSTEQILNIGKKRGYKFVKYNFKTRGKYNLKDSMFNHRDIAHYNTLHKKMAKNMKHEIVHQGNVTTFLRYYNFLGFSVPMVAQLMDTKENQIVEIFTSMFFQFLKVNTEKKIDEKNTESTLEFYVGCKFKFLIFLASPLIKRIVKISFDDYILEDVPYMEIRGKLREQGYLLDKDKDKFTHYDTSKLKEQNIHLTSKVQIPKEVIKIKIDELIDNQVKKINDIDITGFQIFKNENFIKIFPRLCPHEGGCLDVDNSYGGGSKLTDFLENNKVKCTVHSRLFDPLIVIDLNSNLENYETSLYNFKLDRPYLYISIKDNLNNLNNIDWNK